MEPTLTDAERRSRNLAAVRAAFAGVSAADAERQLAQYTDDAVLELPYHDPPVVLDGKATIRRSEFGMTGYLPAVGDEVSLELEGEFQLQE